MYQFLPKMYFYGIIYNFGEICAPTLELIGYF